MQDISVKEYTQKQIIEESKKVAVKAKRILQEISTFIKPGISESEVKLKADEILKAHGISKNWHKPYINFGTNSILTFMDKPKENLVLKDIDIAYIDIGPIINGIEGDAGHTLVFGKDKLFEELQFQSKRIFDLGVKYWKEKKPTGIDLYQYIHKLTEDAGFVFHLNPAGHLIGSFPHIGWKKGLNTYPYTPEEGVWILEVQIRHPEKSYGAFYEEVLL